MGNHETTPCLRRLSTMAALLLALSPASLLPSSQPPAPAYRTLSRRAALLPLLAAPAAVSALPNPFANPEEDKRKAEKEAADKQRSADKQAMYVKVRKERMAAEARAQSDEYTTRMNTYKFDSGTFGSTVSVPAVDEGRFRYKP